MSNDNPTPQTIPMLYVTNAYDSNLQPASNVTAIALGTTDPPLSIPVGSIPETVLAIPSLQLVYVANGGDNTVSVISGALNTVIMTITEGLGPEPWPMVALPDGSKIFVGNNQSQPSGTISVIATNSNKVVDTFTVSCLQGVSELAISPDGSTLYANSENNTEVAVLSTADGSLLGTISLGSVPAGMVVSADGRRLYVANMGTLPAIGTSVTVVSTESNSVTGSIPNVGTGPSYLAFGPGGDCLYVTTESNTVAVLNVAQASVISRIGVGGTPLGITLGLDAKNVYVANFGGATDSVSVISLASNSVTGTLPGGSYAGDLAVLKVTQTSSYSGLLASSVACTFRSSPDPTHNYNFSACSLTIKNANQHTFPRAGVSPWVSLDFYVSTSNTPSSASLTLIGDLPLYISNLESQATMNVDVATQCDGLYNMSRRLLGNPSLLTAGQSYYLYAQVRNPEGTIDFIAGSLSTTSFVYQL